MSEIALPRLGELRDMAAKASAVTGIALTVNAASQLIDGEDRQVDGYSVAFHYPDGTLGGWYSALGWYAASAVISAFQISHELTAA